MHCQLVTASQKIALCAARYTHTHTHAHTRTHARTHARTPTHTQTHKQTNKHTQTYRHTHTDTQTHTHKWELSDLMYHSTGTRPDISNHNNRVLCGLPADVAVPLFTLHCTDTAPNDPWLRRTTRGITPTFSSTSIEVALWDGGYQNTNRTIHAVR